MTRGLPAYAVDAGAYDRRTAAFHDFRAAIVDALPLHRGQVVLDVGCGTGLSFASLLDKVGPRGRIVGIDASPEMLAVARERVAGEGWGNITFVQSPVMDAQIPVIADAAIFCAVHDILRSPEALRRVLDRLLPGAWVTAGGGKWAAPWMVALNWQVQALHRPYVRSFEGFERPWSHLERLIEDVHVRALALGSGYVMTGRVRSRAIVDIAEVRGDLDSQSKAGIRTLLERLGEPGEIAAGAPSASAQRPPPRLTLRG
jgi:SAM-dependent methyltransferase